MKKFLAILMAMMMLCSMMAVAVADEEKTPKYNTQAEISKTYKLDATLSDVNTAKSPKEAFTFSFTPIKWSHDGTTFIPYAEGNMPSLANCSTADFEIGAANDNGTVKVATTAIDASSFNSYGVYHYEVAEVIPDSSTAGVTYSTEKLCLVITIGYEETLEDTDNPFFVAALHVENENGLKDNKIENTYAAGSLEVKKIVTGNLGDREKAFKIEVTLTSDKEVKSTIVGSANVAPENWEKTNDGWTTTVEFDLKNGATFTLNNIPNGVQYSVVETDEAVAAENAEYEVSYDGNEKGTISVAKQTTQITNNKGIDIDTGISLDDLPYIILLAVAAIGIVAMVMKKRCAADRD